jgi:hypothetical protein
MEKKFNTYLTICSLLILASCSIAGSWVYERADSYLADYFKEYANFSNEQKIEIEEITENYLDWFTRNELPEIRAILEDLQGINNKSTNALIKNTYLRGQGLFERTNNYLEGSIIEFSKTLTDLQVNEIKIYFEEIQIKRKESREKEKNYYEEVFNDYVSGFRRLNIRLTKDQKEYVKENIKELKDIRSEWSFFQEKWVKELIVILNKRDDQNFDKKLTNHLRDLQSLGDSEFQLKLKMNQDIGIKIISEILSKASEKQLNNTKRRIETYIASIDRILSNRSLQ